MDRKPAQQIFFEKQNSRKNPDTTQKSATQTQKNYKKENTKGQIEQTIRQRKIKHKQQTIPSHQKQQNKNGTNKTNNHDKK